MEFTKNYECKAINGTVMKLMIKAEVDNIHNDDVREILESFATKSRNFYLSLGGAISNTP